MAEKGPPEVACNEISAPEDDSFHWDDLPAMPTKRVFSTAVAHDGNIYIIGGCDQRGIPLDSFEVFDPSKKAWEVLPNMPTKRAGVTAVVVDNKIVVMGGVEESQDPVDDVEIYDVSERTWQVMQSMKERLLGVSAVVREGKVFVVGGMARDTNPRDHFMCFDITKDKWASLPVMPSPRYATFTFLIDGKLYVLGGRQGKLPVASFDVFDFSQYKWRSLPDIPSKRVFALYTASDTHIFSMGGLNQPADLGFSKACEIYNIEKNEWKVGTDMPYARGDFAISYMDDRVICTGGLGNLGKPMANTEAYDHTTDTWYTLKDCCSTHCSCAHIVNNGKFYVVGGLSMQGPSGCIEALSCHD